MRVDFNVAMEVATHEALVRQTYLDSKRVKTWCVGMTNATGHRVERYVGNPQTIQHCMNLYMWALTNYAEQVKRAFKAKPLNQAQFAAAVSFHWNTGAIASASWVRLWLSGDVAGARKAFMNWVTPKEIAARRQKECDLFFDGKWSNDGTMTEFTRVSANMTPVWASAKKINVAAELRNAFEETADVVLDQQPDPNSMPTGNTLSPDGGEPDASTAPITIEDTTIPAPVGHNGGPPLNPNLSPIDQMNKPVQGAKVNLATGGVGAAALVLLSTAGWLPAAWMTSPDAMLALGIIVPWLGGLVGNFVGSYRAPDKRFQT
jgi:lysozyme